MKNHQNKDY